MVAALALAAGLCMSAERPDFTGVWTNAGAPGIGGATRAAPPTPPPLKPEAKARIEAYQKLVAKTGDTPGGWCLGTGMPGSMLGSGGYPMEIIQRPEQITIIYEAHSETRRVYLGNRNAPEKDRVPGRNGYSSGHWEGDTLVVETIGMKESIDQATAHGENARIVERYTPFSEGGLRRLKVELTIHDPEFYTSSPTLTRTYTQLKEGRILDYACPEEGWEDHLEMLRNRQKNK